MNKMNFCRVKDMLASLWFSWTDSMLGNSLSQHPKGYFPTLIFAKLKYHASQKC